MKQEIKERVERIRKGEVPEGYKETKVGIIPDDWKIGHLEDITKKKGLIRGPFGGSLKKEIFVKNGFKVYEQRNAIYKSVKLGEYFIDEKKFEELRRFKVRKDDFIVSCSGTIGRIFRLPENSPMGVINQALLKITIDFDLVNLDFFQQYFEYVRFQHLIIDNTQGGAMSNLVGMDIFRKTPFPLFLIEEQQKIAKILSTWDKAIELKEKQILHLNEYKKGFMQKLLFKRVTSNILWNETQLKKCLIPTSYSVNKPSEPYYALGIRSHCKGTLVRYIEDPQKIAMDTLYEVKENELIVNITFAWEGAITILSKKDEGKIVSHRFPTYKFNKEYAIPDYFKHLIKTKWFVFQLGLLSPGGAGRNRVLNKTDFLKLKVLLPSVEEQRKISDFLNSIDNEVDLLNKELNLFKEQKRGLMQLLLTGIVRVEVN